MIVVKKNRYNIRLLNNIVCNSGVCFCLHNSNFFYKNKRHLFIQFDKVHQCITNLKSLKTKRMNLRMNSQHPY